MRLFAMACLFTLIAAFVIAMEPEHTPAAPKPPGSNRDWLGFIAARAKTMNRVTDKPMSMDLQVARFCRMPLPQELPEDNPHRGHFVHVYVTPGEEKTIRTGEGKYPVGTLIVKEKFPGPFTPLEPGVQTGTQIIKTEPKLTPELFTVMLKREAGYHPECGDWEFMVVSGDMKQILARGKLDSCVACHKDHKQTDFVTQLYPVKQDLKKN